MGRLKYDRQFKLLAVKLIKDQRMPVTQVSREISVHVKTLHRWLKEYVEHGDTAFPGSGKALLNKDYEIKKLKRENDELRDEIKLLKKLQAFLREKSV